jgi:hypothetical protein
MAGTWVTVRKRDAAGREVLSYPGRVLWRTPTAIALATDWSRPPLDLGYVCFQPGDRWVETFYADRWYNIFNIRSTRGRQKGWYCNITRPAFIGEMEVGADDLALDLWVDARGRPHVLDEEEFAALPLSAEERAAALAALQRLLGLARRGWMTDDEGREE